jgi:signal transduction histidine kinase
MTLSDFIRSNEGPLLEAWESFAKTCTPAAENMSSNALLNQAAEMLRAVAQDIEARQSAARKYQEGGMEAEKHSGTAEAHARARFIDGFDLIQLTAEFSALRASVVRLLEQEPSISADCRELNLFHECIDQLLMDAVVCYNDNMNRARGLFLGTLIHDMRNPLSAISNAVAVLPLMGELSGPQSALLDQVKRSSDDVVKLVNDLADVTRSKLGQGMPISAAPVDLKDALQRVVREFFTTQPERSIKVETFGNLRGVWDASRIGQLLSNLVGNALKHGASGAPVIITATEENDGVKISVHNEGEPIPTEVLPTIFDALTRGHGEKQKQTACGSLGLGLFIAKEITEAHSGRIFATSTREDGTTFTIWLPRYSPTGIKFH